MRRTYGEKPSQSTAPDGCVEEDKARLVRRGQDPATHPGEHQLPRHRGVAPASSLDISWLHRYGDCDPLKAPFPVAFAVETRPAPGAPHIPESSLDAAPARSSGRDRPAGCSRRLGRTARRRQPVPPDGAHRPRPLRRTDQEGHEAECQHEVLQRRAQVMPEHRVRPRVVCGE